MSDFTYVENLAHAYICVEEALDLRTASVAGKVIGSLKILVHKLLCFSILIWNMDNYSLVIFIGVFHL